MRRGPTPTTRRKKAARAPSTGRQRLLLLGVALFLCAPASLRADLTLEDWGALIDGYNERMRAGNRLAAIEVLANCPNEDLKLTRLLVTLLTKRRELPERRALIQILVRTRQDDCVAYLGKQLSSPRITMLVRYDLFQICGRLDSKEIDNTLVGFLSNKVSALRVCALDAIGLRREKALYESVLPLVDDREWQVRYAALMALLRCQRDMVVPLLIERLDVEQGRMRADLLRTLRAMTGGKATGRAAWEKWWERMKTWQRNLPADLEAAFLRDALPPAAGQASYFVISFHANAVMFVIDKSPRMFVPYNGPRPKARGVDWARVKTLRDLIVEETVATLKQLPPATRFNILICRSAPRRWKPELRQATPANVAEAIVLLRRSEGQRRTNLLDAMRRGISLRGYHRDPLHKKNFAASLKTVFLVTHGYPDAGKLVHAKVTFQGKLPWHTMLSTQVRDWTRLRKIRIHTIGLAKPFKPLLEALARPTGGQYVVPPH